MKTDTLNQYGELTGPGEVRFVRLLPGPIERVWTYLTDPEKRATWLAGGPMELRVGGRVELLFRHRNLSPDETPPEKYREAHEAGMTMEGRITAIEPPRLLSYTWEGEGPGDESEVRFELTPKGEQVQLLLTHRKLRRPQGVANVGGGWHLHLAFLAARLEGTTPPAFWARFAELEPEYRQRVEAQLAAK
ncbi:SRPBCC family protein [Opitutus terrae]|uniref:Activator of Hsp90 ATPase 1 family protein n=1 Tax=Opitutus terrae (strain DSM 11246 / JCM 15787 / PB90-1) TaxID=452637 RepID=B1ZRA4_OPITP|nr:SRPBCC family protein [Opitutus terrae]ACB74591.1 Activator of Hsp90 ATPase 1 family protein [Opitutus terrae PB90-1]